MSSEVKVPNLNCVDATIGEFENIVPQKGAIYAADGQVYTKLPPGTNGYSLTADSTQTQGVIWKDNSNIGRPTVTFNLFGCFGWKQKNILYCGFGTDPEPDNHNNPSLMSFHYDVYVVALGFKPRSSPKGEWCGNNPTIHDFSSLWTGTLYINILGCADTVNPNIGLTPMTNVPTPHFTLSDTEIRARTTYMSKYWIAPIPILIPARTKFTIQTSWAPGTNFKESRDHYGSGNLVLRAVI